MPFAASGDYEVVRGGAPARPGEGAAMRYLVEVERGLPFDPDTFALAACHFIGGAAVTSAPGMALRRPSDGAVLVDAPIADAEIVDRAVETAQRALRSSGWGAGPADPVAHPPFMSRPDRALVLYERALERDPHQDDVTARVNFLLAKGARRPQPD